VRGPGDAGAAGGMAARFCARGMRGMGIEINVGGEYFRSGEQVISNHLRNSGYCEVASASLVFGRQRGGRSGRLWGGEGRVWDRLCRREGRRVGAEGAEGDAGSVGCRMRLVFFPEGRLEGEQL